MNRTQAFCLLMTVVALGVGYQSFRLPALKLNVNAPSRAEMTQEMLDSILLAFGPDEETSPVPTEPEPSK